MNTTDTAVDSMELESGLTRYAIGEPLTTTPEEQEELRVYAVRLRVAGTDIEFGLEVPLRYDLETAAGLDVNAPEALSEAYRRACRIERKGSKTSPDTIFQRASVTWLRSGLRDART